MKYWTRIRHYPRAGLVILAFAAFIALGMPDGLTGVAWPSIRADFAIPLDAVGLLLATSVTGYLTATFLSGMIITRIGVGSLLAASCALTGAGLVGFTLVPAWWMMVALGLAAGLGAGAIDAGLNIYAAAHFSEGLMQWLHASYGIGITLGPMIMTMTLEMLGSWRGGFWIVGVSQLALALCFVLTLPVWNQEELGGETVKPQRLTDYRTPLLETLRQPGVWMSALLFFFYTGSEATLGIWAYTLFTESRGIAHQTSGFYIGCLWASFTMGRIIAGLNTRRVGIDRLVWGSLAAALAASLLLLWNPLPLANLVAVVLAGFAIAPLFPAMISGTSRRVGVRFAANTIGLQMAAGSLGVAAIPAAAGVLARRDGLELIPLVLIGLFVALLGLYALAIRLSPGR